MSSAFLLLYLFQALGADAGFQDGIVPRAAAATTDGLPAACATVDFALSFCSSVSPGFATMDVTDQAPCLCYSSTTWNPNEFDGAVYTCAQYASTALPASAYSDLVDLEGFCSSVGNVDVGAGPASVPAATTAAVVLTTPAPRPAITSATGEVDIFTNPGCSYVGFALDYCNSVTPGFSTLDLTSQAPCLCYSSVNPTSDAWIPGVFDGSVLTCADFVSSVAPQSLSDITDLENFCTDIGDIRPGAGVGATNTGGNGVPVATNNIGSPPKQATPTPGASSKPGVVATIVTPVPTTIAQAPTAATASRKLGRASSFRSEAKSMWAFGLISTAFSLVILA